MACCTPAFTYNDASFRAMFKAFADKIPYPQDVLQMYYDAAGQYVANSNYGPLAAACATQYALYLMTAHLTQLGDQIAAGTGSGITISAAIDKISTAIQQINSPNQWQYWLNSTEYGKQLLALLQVKSVGGFYIPGGPGRAGFRRF